MSDTTCETPETETSEKMSAEHPSSKPISPERVSSKQISPEDISSEHTVAKEMADKQITLRHTSEQSTGKENIWTRNFIFICLSNFLVFLGFQMLIPTLPLYVKELGGGDTLVGLVVGIFALSALLIRPWSGHALETLGRRMILLTGLLIFIISVSSFAIVGSLFILFAMRIVQGMGWGLSTTAAGTVATDLIPPKRRGEGIGYYGLSGNIAMAFGPTLGLTVAALFNFPLLFSISAFLGTGALILAILIRYQPTLSATPPQNSGESMQKPAKKRKLDVFEKSALPASTLLMFIAVTFGGISSFLPIYAETEGVAGIEIYFLIYALSMMGVRIFAGKVYDRNGMNAIFLPGTLSIMIGMLLLALMNHTWMLLSAAVFYGAGFGAIQPALQAWAITAAPMNRKGMANATFFSCFDLGIGVGAMFFGVVSHWVGYSGIYLVAAGSVLMSIVLYFTLFQKQAKQILT